MNKISRIISLAMSLASVIATSTFLSSCGGGDYYATINDDLYDAPLEKALRNIISNNKFISYTDAPTHFEKTEADPKKPGNILLFYTGESYTPTITSYGTSKGSLTTEHVWCQSYFRVYSESRNSNDYSKLKVPTPYSDLHNLRPCEYSINSVRSNHMFGENTTQGNYNPFDPKNLPKGDETYRGEIARAIFYVATRYEELDIIEGISASTISSYQIGKLSDLLKWNLEYDITDREITRNEEIYKIQGNRNPFVDHREYACRIWGNKNDAARAVCGAYL